MPWAAPNAPTLKKPVLPNSLSMANDIDIPAIEFNATLKSRSTHESRPHGETTYDAQVALED
jgi:hypothetical protein